MLITSLLPLLAALSGRCVEAAPTSLPEVGKKFVKTNINLKLPLDDKQDGSAPSAMQRLLARDFNGSPSSAVRGISDSFKPGDKWFPLAISIVAVLGAVVLVCVFKALRKCSKQEKYSPSFLPHTRAADQQDPQPNKFTRFGRRKPRKHPHESLMREDITPPLSPGGTSFLTVIPERTVSRSSSKSSIFGKKGEDLVVRAYPHPRQLEYSTPPTSDDSHGRNSFDQASSSEENVTEILRSPFMMRNSPPRQVAQPALPSHFESPLQKLAHQPEAAVSDPEQQAASTTGVTDDRYEMPSPPPMRMISTPAPAMQPPPRVSNIPSPKQQQQSMLGIDGTSTSNLTRGRGRVGGVRRSPFERVVT